MNYISAATLTITKRDGIVFAAIIANGDVIFAGRFYTVNDAAESISNTFEDRITVLTVNGNAADEFTAQYC